MISDRSSKTFIKTLENLQILHSDGKNLRT